ncbi:MAG: Cro/CI family transcriptional regulator [Sphingobium sp.]|nr:Cro/CI family transcriptional regulator [Sphingobium sp.]
MVVDQESPSVLALRKAVDLLGGQSAMARLVGVTQQAVWKWIAHGKELPAEHVLKVEANTGISRHLLRPDLYPLEERGGSVVDRLNGARA